MSKDALDQSENCEKCKNIKNAKICQVQNYPARARHRMVLHGIALYLMVSHSFHVVSHGIAWYCIISYGIAWYCIVGFGARAVSRKTPIFFICLN